MDGKLTAAQQQLLTCSQASCPAAVSRECAKWLEEIKQSLPSIVVIAKGVDGEDVTDVTVFVDGQQIAESLTGRAVPLDPGSHVLRFEHRSETPVEQTLVVREGVKNRAVEVSFGGDAAGARTGGAGPSERSAPIGAYVLGAVGLASLGVFTGLAVAGTSEVEDLRDTCGQTSSCTDDEIDSARETLIIGDVFLGVGAAALSVGVVWLIVHYVTEPDADSDSTDTALQVDVVPGPAGAFLAARWSF